MTILSLFATDPTTTSAGSSNPLNAIQGYIGPVVGCVIAFFVIFWVSLVIWTYRDIRSRTQDFLSQVLATVLAFVFPIGGVFIYMILRPRQTLAEVYERQLEEESLLAEMTERQTCTNCHARIEGDFQVCPSCGHKLKRSCPKCERLLELRWTFCPYCTTNLTGAPMPNMPGGMQSMPPMPNPNVAMNKPMAGNRY
jgi:RNA polymerase subunit RPABC4/transcription elongation factor Spt4